MYIYSNKKKKNQMYKYMFLYFSKRQVKILIFLIIMVHTSTLLFWTHQKSILRNKNTTIINS